MTILVTYASRSGSTVGIAQAIGETLANTGLAVDVRSMTEVKNITPYQAIVAGSAIRQEQWLPEALHFLEAHQPELRQKPVALFLSCMALVTDNPQRYNTMLQTANTWMAPARQLVKPVSEGYFAGTLDLSKIEERRFRLALGLLVRIGIWSEGDYRNWNAIQQWATTLPEQLISETNIEVATL